MDRPTAEESAPCLIVCFRGEASEPIILTTQTREARGASEDERIGRVTARGLACDTNGATPGACPG